MSPQPRSPSSDCELSVILPAYNAASLLRRSLETLSAYLDGLGVSWEIVLVDDGSEDETAGQAERLCAQGNCRYVRLEENRGKGRAVSEGMLRARGKYRIFTDIDLPYSLDSIGRCYGLLATGESHAVFGNRKLPGSASDVALPLLRRLGSRGFGWLAGAIIGRRDLDTQCGLKGFSGELAGVLFPMLRVERFGFDVELSLLLNQAGVEIRSIPVRLVNQDVSTVTVLGGGLQTMLEMAGVWLRKALGRYDVQPLERFR